MVNSLPDGVYLTSLKQAGRSITLKGYAQSNARVSSFMRKLEASAWLRNPDLSEIRAETKPGEAKGASEMRLSAFTLRVTQATPEGEEEEQGR